MVSNKLENFEKNRDEQKQVLNILEEEVKQLIDIEQQLQGKLCYTEVTEERVIKELTEQLDIIEQLKKEVEFE